MWFISELGVSRHFEECIERKEVLSNGFAEIVEDWECSLASDIYAVSYNFCTRIHPVCIHVEKSLQFAGLAHLAPSRTTCSTSTVLQDAW